MDPSSRLGFPMSRGNSAVAQYAISIKFNRENQQS